MSVQFRPNQAKKTTKSTRLQETLIQSKTTMVLFREFLLEVKEVFVVITMILFFLLGVITAIVKLYG
jgi:hypothetical protein